jgi:hypothetical protein
MMMLLAIWLLQSKDRRGSHGQRPNRLSTADWLDRLIRHVEKHGMAVEDV